MPIYEYECLSCGHRFEKLVKMGGDAPPCPACEAAVRKLVSRSGFILQGGGWYKDHYGLKKGDSSTSTDASKSAAPKTEAPASSPKTDSTTTPTTTPSTKAAAAK